MCESSAVAEVQSQKCNHRSAVVVAQAKSNRRSRRSPSAAQPRSSRSGAVDVAEVDIAEVDVAVAVDLGVGVEVAGEVDVEVR